MTNKPEVPTEMLRRQADQLLLMAARSGDTQLLREAEALYKRLEVDNLPWTRTGMR
ncbi:hypothetical protein ACFTAO_04190 [Paenibacillus rhizoplanae]